MNMINCGERCLHQKNGYCMLDGRAKISDSAGSGCCYFRREETDKKAVSEVTSENDKG